MYTPPADCQSYIKTHDGLHSQEMARYRLYNDNYYLSTALHSTWEKNWIEVVDRVRKISFYIVCFYWHFKVKDECHST